MNLRALYTAEYLTFFCRAFSVVDDIFCLFNGHIENIASLKQLYGLTKTANEVSIIIEAYRSLRDRGSSPADHALRNIEGKFAFVIFDSSTKSTFIAVVNDSNIPPSHSLMLELMFAYAYNLICLNQLFCSIRFADLGR